MLLLLLLLLLISPPPRILALNQEGLYLQQVKLGLDDPDSVLSNWNDRDDTPCNWTGITCDSATHSVNRVDLPDSNLAGPFPTHLCHLRNLSYISFSNNLINSSIPSNISTCQNLRHLILDQNLLVGPIPSSLADLPGLQTLILSMNNLSGQVPTTFSRFDRLEVISLTGNFLTGPFPEFFANVSTLKELNLSYNSFDLSPFPSRLTNVTSLEVLWFTSCNIYGRIPDSIGQLKNLVNLDLAVNRLVGPIPSSLTELTSIYQIELYNNSLTGGFPVGMSKLTQLRRIDLSMNELEGPIPDELCQLPLSSLNLYQNRFTGPLPVSIAKSPNLYELRLFTNQLTGSLPSELGKNSPLQVMDASDNLFNGEIPPNLCANGELQELLLISNSITGSIPLGLGECKSLARLRVRNNKLSGEVPPAIWGLPSLILLDLMWNSFSGSIETTISSASNLSGLLISGNQLKGMLPSEMGLLNALVEFSGNDNSFTGSIPETFVNLTQLGRLDLHNNHLSGVLPKGMGSLKQLNELNLANNELTGEIPGELGSLPVLNYLDLSGNRISGKIPFELQNLKLNRFNLSENRLSGDIPPFYAKEAFKDSFLGNPGLCGDLEGLCPTREESKRNSNAWLLRLIFVLAAVVFVVGVAWLFVKYRNYKKAKKGIDKSKWILTSFHKLDFSEYEILDCLDEDNVIGTGASGKVYKAILSNGEAVAVKKLWGGSQKDDDIEKGRVTDDGYKAEVETLGKIRHKNIVRLWCCCTTRDCKLLVYEYMPNGSLGDLLHSNKGGLLDWPVRYKIAMDAAEGLAYLHHDCVPPIVHRDVKSNNILLDGEFGARVADFGVAKEVDAVAKGPKSMSVIAGSCGYIAPEYAYTLRVNEKSDTYSFGVVILELVTGKKPIDPEFGEKDLVKWVCTSLDQKGVDCVIDPKLDACFKEEICRVLNIGLLCTNPLPINRPSMRRVVKMLQELRTENKPKIISKDGKLSPYYYEDYSDQGSSMISVVEL